MAGRSSSWTSRRLQENLGRRTRGLTASWRTPAESFQEHIFFFFLKASDFEMFFSIPLTVYCLYVLDEPPDKDPQALFL